MHTTSGGRGRMAMHIRRREFIFTLGGAAAAWPLAARAQQPAKPAIGYIDVTTAADTVYRVSAFREGLKDAGFIDGHNVAIEFRWAENKLDRLPALAADLVRRRVAVNHARGPGRHLAHTDRVRQRRRSDRNWSRYQYQPAWRQYHRGELWVISSTAKTPGTAA